MPRPKKSGPTTRLNLEMNVAVRERMERLRDVTDAESLTEVIRRSLAIYEVLWDAKHDGGRVMIRSNDGEREVIIL